MRKPEPSTSSGLSSEGHIQHNALLNSSEIAQLWATYMHYSMLACIFAYFEKTARDAGVKELMNKTLVRCEKRAHFAYKTLQLDGQPSPIGFSQQDVNLNAPPLFVDNFMLHYLRHLLRISFSINGINLSMASRPDIREFYSEVLESAVRLMKIVNDILQAKGILPSAPFATVYKEVEFTQSNQFLTGYLGRKRPLLAAELSHLYFNSLTNEIGRTLALGFRQVTPSKDLKDYLTDGIGICDKIIATLSALSVKEDVYFRIISDGDVTDSVEPPFSDRLIMFHLNTLSMVGIGMYGVSMAASPRRDIAATYARIIMDVSKHADKGARLAIAKGWVEEPPHIVDREELAYRH